jgi:hypothetical protein
MTYLAPLYLCIGYTYTHQLKGGKFLRSLEKESAMDTKWLEYIQGLRAKEVVKQQAKAVMDLLQCCLTLALYTCATQTTVNSKSTSYF